MEGLLMHELSIACSLVKAAVDEATRHGATHVLKLDVVLGALSGVEMDSLMFCFPAVAKGTLCEGAGLHVEVVPAVGRCPGCLTLCEVSDFMSACPGCGSWPLGIKGGREMTLRAVEIE
jgi:hydrogenase nickel incorporation protein HypA/HybF